MKLKKGGPVYTVLKWYGYPDWRLREGISLCKTFWSIVAGVLLLTPGRLVRKVAILLWRSLRAMGRGIATAINAEDALSRRIDRRYGRYAAAFVSWTIYVAVGLLLSAGVLWATPGPLTWRSLITVFLVAELAAFAILVLAARLSLWSRTPAADRVADSFGEFGKVVGGYTSAIKQKVCPTITFEGAGPSKYDRPIPDEDWSPFR